MAITAIHHCKQYPRNVDNNEFHQGGALLVHHFVQIYANSLECKPLLQRACIDFADVHLTVRPSANNEVLAVDVDRQSLVCVHIDSVQGNLGADVP